MSEKIELVYESDIVFYKCASVGENWEEEYADNETVLTLISKLISAETPEDDGVSEAMEDLLIEIGGGEETCLNICGRFTIDGESPEDENLDDDDAGYSVEDGSLYLNAEFKTTRSLYENQIETSKLCVTEEAQNGRHLAKLKIDKPFDFKKLEFKDGWLFYDGESFESDGSEGKDIGRGLYVDGEEPYKLDYIAEVENGMILIDSEYVSDAGFEEGTQLEIKITRNAIKLVRLEDED